MAISAEFTAFINSRNTELQRTPPNLKGSGAIEEIYYIESLLGNLGGGGGGGGSSAPDFEALVEYEAIAAGAGYAIGDVLVRIRTVSSTGAISYSWANATAGTELAAAPSAGDITRPSTGGGASGGGGPAIVSADQSVDSSVIIQLPEYDEATPANTANPLISSLPANITAVAITWRPSDSYFDNAETDEVAASVLRDCVCWSIIGNPSPGTPAANIAVLNQAAGSIVLLNRDLALSLRAGAHISPGGDPVYAHVLRLTGTPAANMTLLPTPLDIASYTDRSGSGSGGATPAPSTFTFVILNTNTDSSWVALTNTSNKFGGLFVPSGLPTGTTSLTFRIRRSTADVTGVPVYSDGTEVSITFPDGGGAYISPSDLVALSAGFGGSGVELRIVLPSAVTADATFYLESP